MSNSDFIIQGPGINLNEAFTDYAKKSLNPIAQPTATRALINRVDDQYMVTIQVREGNTAKMTTQTDRNIFAAFDRAKEKIAEKIEAPKRTSTVYTHLA